MSQPCDGDTKTTRSRPGHDGHGHRHGHDHAQSHHPQSRHTKERARAIPHDTQHVNRTNIRANRRSIEHVYQCCAYNKPPGRGVSPRSKSRGRWLSSADAECSLEHFWITCYSRSLHIFSGCNRCCTLHIVYNVPWIDVDGGEASLSHINVWPSTHKGSVKILDAVRSAVRLVYLGRGLYGLVPIILGWSAIMLAQPFGCRVRFPRFALGFMGVAACEIDGIARISPLEHVGDKRLPALIRWLMTEGEARPNGCIYTYTFLAVGGKSQSTIPLSCQLGQ